MREIVVLSGKGGTGKTSISSSFSYLEKDNAVTCDCDVDAANMHILLKADFKKQYDFYSAKVANINEEKCRKCGLCLRMCNFGAISIENGVFKVDPLKCEGCGLCSHICRFNAIDIETQKTGDVYQSGIKNNGKMVHAILGFAAENSGRLVAKVKQDAKILALKEDKSYVITDGSPGIGCPVIASIGGASLIVLVSEATKSGLHDLKRVYEVVKKFKLSAVCIINKFDLNLDVTKETELFLKENSIELIAKLPYDETFTKALVEAKPIVEYDPKSVLSEIVEKSWEKIKLKIKELEK